MFDNLRFSSLLLNSANASSLSHDLECLIFERLVDDVLLNEHIEISYNPPVILGIARDGGKKRKIDLVPFFFKGAEACVHDLVPDVIFT